MISAHLVTFSECVRQTIPPVVRLVHAWLRFQKQDACSSQLSMAQPSQDVLAADMSRFCHDLCDVVYLTCDDSELREATQSKGAELQMTWPPKTGGGFQALSALLDLDGVGNDILVVAFRGTFGKSEWMEYKSEAFVGDNFTPLDSGTDCVVWAVWMETLKRMWSTNGEQAGTGPPKTMKDAVYGHLRQRKKVWLTGHSKGGAVATTAAAHLLCPQGSDSLLEAGQLAHLSIVTFSSPLVFKAGFADVYEKARNRFGVAHLRIQHQDDIVPSLPFRGAFAHVGTEKMIERGPQSPTDASQAADMFPTSSEGIASFLLQWIGIGMAKAVRTGLAHKTDATAGLPGDYAPAVQDARKTHDGSNPWERGAAPITAILVGKSGAGKSALGNKLLNARLAPEEAKSFFREGGGSAGVTGRVDHRVSTDRRMKVIDTPGIPDPDSSKTIDNFDAIILMLRDEPAVNLLIFLVKEDRTDETQFRDYRTLLKHFNNIPCQKLMVCRQSEYSHPPNPKARAKKREEGVAFVTDIQKRSGMDMPYMLYLDGTSDEAEQSFQNIAKYVDISSHASLGGCPSLRTYLELKSVVRSLASKKYRLKELEKVVVELRREVERKRMWLEISKAAGMCSKLILRELGEAIIMPLVTYSETTIETTVARLTRVEAELANGSVDEGMLDEFKAELEELETLRHSHGARGASSGV